MKLHSILRQNKVSLWLVIVPCLTFCTSTATAKPAQTSKLTSRQAVDTYGQKVSAIANEVVPRVAEIGKRLRSIHELDAMMEDASPTIRVRLHEAAVSKLMTIVEEADEQNKRFKTISPVPASMKKANNYFIGYSVEVANILNLTRSYLETDDNSNLVAISKRAGRAERLFALGEKQIKPRARRKRSRKGKKQ